MRSMFSPFPIEVCKYSFKSPMEFDISHCWTSGEILTPKRFKKYTSCTKTKMLKLFDSFGVILKCFEGKRCNVHFKKGSAQLVFSFLSRLCWNLEQNPPEMYRNCIKNDKTSNVHLFKHQIHL